jgi:catechol 2,3-dioxygenase-like lactoylglutathione lyase family enzyme
MSANIEKAFEGGLFAVTLLTQDLVASEHFYAELLGLTKVWGDEVSAIYKVGKTMINVLADTQASELLAPAELAEYGSGEKLVFTLRCADVDAAVNELLEAGVEMLNGPIDRPWGVRTASFQDPSGNIWELANHA